MRALILLLGVCACAARPLSEANLTYALSTEGSGAVDAYRAPPEGCASIVAAIDFLDSIGDREHVLWSTTTPTTERIFAYEIDAGIRALATIGNMAFCDLSKASDPTSAARGPVRM